MALLASGQVCDLREVVLSCKPHALLQASAKGTVPVLVLPEGVVLEQSLDIMLWTLRHNDRWGWLPDTTLATEQTLTLVAQCDGTFKHDLDRYKYPARYGLQNGLHHRHDAAKFLHHLNVLLEQHGHLHRKHFGLADAAIVPFVRQFAHTDLGWFGGQPWPHLQCWLNAWENSPTYQAVMTKYSTWKEEQAPVQFPAPAP